MKKEIYCNWGKNRIGVTEKKKVHIAKNVASRRDRRTETRGKISEPEK